MIADLQNYAEGAIIDTDVCVIGAGAAGITAAVELAGSGKDIVVLESGGMSLEMDTQALYDAENVGLARRPMINSRLRMFGGTTNHWAGRCSPLSTIDFQRREWVPHSGWPVTRSELDPFYEKAHVVCDLGPCIYDDRVLKQFNIPDPRLDSRKLRPHYWALSPPTRFGSKYEKQLKEAKNVRVLLHANTVNVQTNAAASHVEYVDVKTLGGKAGKVRAKVVMICCGGIENARLLLASNRIQPNGVGNDRDLVGRFFQEHMRSWQEAVPTRTPYSLRRFYNIYSGATGSYLVGASMSEDMQKAERLLNCAAMTFFENGDYDPFDAAMRVVRGASGREKAEHMGGDIWSVLADFDEMVMSVRARFLLKGQHWRADDATTLVIETEQSPNPNSRISLSDQRDSLGVLRAKVDWRLTDLDRRSSLAMAKTVAAEWGRMNQARLRVPNWLLEGEADWASNFKDVGHHIGTTRMSDDQQFGVVDRNCKVHGIDNLYVGGASVFPTSGHVNPTLTIVALALRTASHLKSIPA
jgi:choline dehydrogenase-like flavoprotein